MEPDKTVKELLEAKKKLHKAIDELIMAVNAANTDELQKTNQLQQVLLKDKELQKSFNEKLLAIKQKQKN